MYKCMHTYHAACPKKKILKNMYTFFRFHYWLLNNQKNVKKATFTKMTFGLKLFCPQYHFSILFKKKIIKKGCEKIFMHSFIEAPSMLCLYLQRWSHHSNYWNAMYHKILFMCCTTQIMHSNMYNRYACLL